MAPKTNSVDTADPFYVASNKVIQLRSELDQLLDRYGRHHASMTSECEAVEKAVGDLLCGLGDLSDNLREEWLAGTLEKTGEATEPGAALAV